MLEKHPAKEHWIRCPRRGLGHCEASSDRSETARYSKIWLQNSRNLRFTPTASS